MHRTWIGMALAVVAVAVPAPASGHDQACIESLWQAPLESLGLPAEWAILHALVETDGSILLILDGPVVGTFEPSGEEIRASASVLVACMPDPRGYIERRARFDAIDGRRTIDLLTVGDWSRATERPSDPSEGRPTAVNVEIEWAHGAIYGVVASLQSVDTGAVDRQALAGIAIAVDDALGALPRSTR